MKRQLSTGHLVTYSLPHIHKTSVSASSPKSVCLSLFLEIVHHPDFTGVLVHLLVSFQYIVRPLSYIIRTITRKLRPLSYIIRTITRKLRPLSYIIRADDTISKYLLQEYIAARSGLQRNYHRRVASMFDINAARGGLQGVCL
jgi:hypothetical protein